MAKNLDKQITGTIEHPRVQQQHRHPQKSHLTLIGKFFLKVTLTRVTVALNSSGATRAWRPVDISVSNRFDKPNLKTKIICQITTTHLSYAMIWQVLGGQFLSDYLKYNGIKTGGKLGIKTFNQLNLEIMSNYKDQLILFSYLKSFLFGAWKSVENSVSKNCQIATIHSSNA